MQDKKRCSLSSQNQICFFDIKFFFIINKYSNTLKSRVDSEPLYRDNGPQLLRPPR